MRNTKGSWFLSHSWRCSVATTGTLLRVALGRAQKITLVSHMRSLCSSPVAPADSSLFYFCFGAIPIHGSAQGSFLKSRVLYGGGGADIKLLSAACKASTFLPELSLQPEDLPNLLSFYFLPGCRKVTPIVLKVYFWLCSQESLLEGLRDHMG